jgi:hypothetical protein
MRWGRIALVAGILVVAGGITAASLGLFAYDKVTKIDRSDPEVVTDEYLRASLVRKDKAGADLYSCEDQAGLTSIVELRQELDRRERDFGVTILVSWGAYARTGDLLTTNLTFAAHKDGIEQSSSSQTWRFTVRNDGGWRVCSAEKLAVEPSATPTTAR